jgi:hypothetical protein
MALLLRSVAALLSLCGLLVLGALLIGDASREKIVTGYHENESQIYNVYVEDPSHAVRLQLAGTRCFEALPPWVYNNNPDAHIAIIDIGRSYVKRDADARDVVERLRCHPYR